MRYLQLLCMVFLFSCSGKQDVPKGIISTGEMEPILWDYLRADVYTAEFIDKDSSRNANLENVRMQEAIFKKYGITREEFYKSLRYYLSHGDQFSPLIDSLIASHQMEQRTIYHEKTTPIQKRKSELPKKELIIHEQSIQ